MRERRLDKFVRSSSYDLNARDKVQLERKKIENAKRLLHERRLIEENYDL